METHPADVKLGDIAHDRQAEAAARHRFIMALATTEDMVAGRLLKARPVVLDAESEPVIAVLQGDANLRFRPFTGVVHEIADHLLKILAFAQEDKILAAGDGDLDPAIAIDSRQGSPEFLGDRRDAGAFAKYAPRGLGAGARQMICRLYTSDAADV